jgi:hypothetical protein
MSDTGNSELLAESASGLLYMLIKTGPFRDSSFSLVVSILVKREEILPYLDEFTSYSQDNYNQNITAFSQPISLVKLLLFKFLICSTQMGCALCYPCSMPFLKINRLCDD